MKARSLVDVVIPCFNSELTVARAVRSVLAQGDCIGKIILVNDGSRDATGRVIRELARTESPNIEIIETTNRGACSARMTGVSRTTSNFIAFLDSDDRWSPGKISQQLELMTRQPHVLATSTGFRELTERSGEITRARTFCWTRSCMRQWVLLGSAAPALNSTLVIYRHHYLSLGGHDRALGSYADDLDLGWRLWTAGGVTSISQPLVELGVSPHQSHRNSQSMAIALREVLGRIENEDPEIVKGASQYLDGVFKLRKLVAQKSWHAGEDFLGWLMSNLSFVATVIEARLKIGCRKMDHLKPENSRQRHL